MLRGKRAFKESVSDPLSALSDCNSLMEDNEIPKMRHGRDISAENMEELLQELHSSRMAYSKLRSP